MIWLLSLFVLWATVPLAEADVYFEEELINPGFGSKKTGARKTINKVYLKDKRQKVDAQIVVDKKTEKVLKKQGQPLRSSMILNLGKAEIYEIDLDAQTFVHGKVPPVRPAVAQTAAKKINAPAPPQIGFSYKVPGDSSVVAGIACKRVVAQMRARHYSGETLKRENHYTYDVCIAKNFPGLDELRAFKVLQDTSTSYPSLVGGGLEQFSKKAEDLEDLEKKLAGLAEELDGFALKSTLTASVLQAKGKKPTEIFRLERQVKVLRHAAIPDSLFSVSKALTQVKK